MAKMEKIRNMQVVDNKQYKFFCFPMISMVCTGSGYKKRINSLLLAIYPFLVLRMFPFCSRIGAHPETLWIYA